MTLTCERDGGPAGCPYVVVACDCDNPEGDPGYGGHDVCGGCHEYPDACTCTDAPEPVPA